MKSVTLADGKHGYFPDGQPAKQALHELMHVVDEGHRAVQHMVMHTGIESVSPAKHIDPKYAELTRLKRLNMALEFYAVKCTVNEKEIDWRDQLQCACSAALTKF